MQIDPSEAKPLGRKVLSMRVLGERAFELALWWIIPDYAAISVGDFCCAPISPFFLLLHTVQLFAYTVLTESVRLGGVQRVER
jgi:hypothetical protein